MALPRESLSSESYEATLPARHHHYFVASKQFDIMYVRSFSYFEKTENHVLAVSTGSGAVSNTGMRQSLL